jgi:hypothetical protein
LSYANVISTLALILVVGGGSAIAANGGLEQGSVGPKQIRKNAVGPVKIKEGAVTNSKLANGAVTASKLAPGAVTLGNGQVGSSNLADGSVTSPKLAEAAVTGGKLANNSVSGTKLANGAVGAGKLGTINTQTASQSVPAGEIRGLSVSCLPGETLLSGGASWVTTGPEQIVVVSETNKSNTTPNTWHAAGTNEAKVALTFNVFAYCLAP